MKKKIWIVALSVLGLLLLAVLLFARSNHVSPLSWNVHNAFDRHEGIALKGFDPISYYESGKPMEGSSNHEASWGGALWRFSSEANKKTFLSDPEIYAPQYGGYCAFAVSKGFTAVGEPSVWELIDGKLYIFNSDEVKSDWMSQLGEGVIEVCNSNWQGSGE